ncbi:MAG TPA: nickel pincer cofactor biosynthesis protein LarC [Terriglobia bacterium]|nr:nickel pincer cofactor biosynthesis protein LarC [Terriglobia bacterium]
MKTLYLDLFSGISGDMFIGALLDLGLDAQQLERELGKLPVNGYHLHIGRQHKSSIAGVKFDVHLESEHHHDPHEHAHEHAHPHEHGHAHGSSHSHTHDEEERTFAQIRSLIQQSSLSDWVKQKAVAVFQRLAIAEGKIHGIPPEKVHFHEVGALDSIVDVVGGCIGLELLGRPRLLAGPVVEGSGWVDCAHGRFPVPAPATLAILGARGIPVSQCSEPHELVTPTGAALLAELAESFGPMQGLVAEKIGFGLGTRENKTRPNVLRAVLGETRAQTSAHDWQLDTVTVLETNLDDISAEVLGNFIDLALARGALDVFYVPVHMKKNRPGVLLTLLCAESEADRFTELILRETTSFGVRRHAAERRKLAREIISVPTNFGPIEVKLGRLDGRVVQAAPEYESCRQAAAAADVPVRQVYQAALRAIDPGDGRS